MPSSPHHHVLRWALHTTSTRVSHVCLLFRIRQAVRCGPLWWFEEKFSPRQLPGRDYLARPVHTPKFSSFSRSPGRCHHRLHMSVRLRLPVKPGFSITQEGKSCEFCGSSRTLVSSLSNLNGFGFLCLSRRLRCKRDNSGKRERFGSRSDGLLWLAI